MNTTKLVTRISSLVTALAATTANADDLYLNDFATRTSKEPIPAIGVWQTAQPYPAEMAFLACRPSGTASVFDFTSLSTYFAGNAEGGFSRPCIDGWFTPWFNGNATANGYKHVPRFYYPFDGSLSDNPVFTWSYGSSNPQTGCIVQPIHNEFTNGQLRIQVDMKAPIKWVRAKISGTNEPVSTMKIFPVYRKYMDILAWGGDLCDMTASPGKFGFRSSGNVDDASCLRSFPQYWDVRNKNDSTTQLGNNDSGSYTDNGVFGKTNYWFRFIVTYDLDSNTFSGETYRFSTGKGHPSFDTAPSDANPNKTFSGATVMSPLTAETGGISGIAFSSYGRFYTTDAANAGNKVFADNIRLSWKAPGASDFEVFYENDFTTRRYKTLCASDYATTAAYASYVATVAETNSFSGYTATTTTDSSRIVRTTVNSTLAQPIGLDGWRKLPFYAKMNGNPAVVAYGGNTANDVGGTGGNMLTYGDQSGVSRLVQTLGTAFSSGTVRIVADARLPWGSGFTTELPATVKRRLGIGLGSAALYDADRANVPANLAGGFGYERLAATGGCLHKPFTIVSGGASEGEPGCDYPASYTAPASNVWYRIDVSADLGTRKYDVMVTPLGATSVTADDAASDPPIFSATGLDFAANVSDIGSFYLTGYGYGNAASNGGNINNRVCWDNIRVWHDADLVYENDFTTRRRMIAAATRETGDVAALQYNLDGGQDHWVRRDYKGAAGLDARAWVRDDNGNTFLALGRSGEEGRTITLVNSLGLSQDKPFRFEADIRPPSQWSAKNGYATISLGDSQMIQTETPDAFYTAHELVSFGFNGTNTQNQTQCPYYFAGCKAQVGGTELDAEIDTTHWYRFRLEVNPENNTYSAIVRDMGTEHPTADTKGGTVVATASNVAFDNALASGEGVSTILIEGQNVSGAYGSLGVDPAHILIDNIRLTVPSPFVILMR